MSTTDPNAKADIFIGFINGLDASSSNLYADAIVQFSIISAPLLLIFYSFRLLGDLKDGSGYKDGFWALITCTTILAAFSVFANQIFDIINALDEWLVAGSMENWANHMTKNLQATQAIVDAKLSENIEGNNGIWTSIYSTLTTVAGSVLNLAVYFFYVLSKFAMFAFNVFLNMAQETLLFVAVVWSFFVIPTGVLKENAWAWAPLKLSMVLIIWKIVLYAMVFVIANAVDTGLEGLSQINPANIDGFDRTSILMVFTLVNFLVIMSMVVSPFVAIYLVNKQAGAAPIVAGYSVVAGGATYIMSQSKSFASKMKDSYSHGGGNGGAGGSQSDTPPPPAPTPPKAS